MEQELFNLYNSFYTAVEKLRASHDDAKETLEKNELIEKFLFSVDIFIKIIKILLKRHNIHYTFPDKCINAAVKFGILASEPIYQKMLEDNFKILHLNNKRCPEELFVRIQVRYVPLLTNFLQKLREDHIV